MQAENTIDETKLILSFFVFIDDLQKLFLNPGSGVDVYVVIVSMNAS